MTLGDYDIKQARGLYHKT